MTIRTAGLGESRAAEPLREKPAPAENPKCGFFESHPDVRGNGLAKSPRGLGTDGSQLVGVGKRSLGGKKKKKD
jgi:hypothetical protein